MDYMDYAMDMVRHNHKNIQFYLWKMIWNHLPT